MFLTLLIVTQATAEWVEISQQHYVKPMHTYSIHNPFTNPNRMEVEETTKPWIYNNKSVSEYNWNKSSKAQSYTGNSKRLQSKGAPKPAETIRVHENKFSKLDSDEFDLRTNYEPTRPPEDFSNNDRQKGIIEKVPNVGNVKRVQLNNTPVKSPVVNIKGDGETIATNRYEELPLNNEPSQGSLGATKVSSTTSNKRRIYLNNLRMPVNNQGTHDFPVDQEELFPMEAQVSRKPPKADTKGHVNLPDVSRKPTHNTQTEGFTHSGKNEDRFQKVDRSKPAITEKKYIFTTQPSLETKDVVTQNNKQLHKQSSSQIYKNYASKVSGDKRNELSKHQPQTELKKNHNEVNHHDQKILNNDKEIKKGPSIENEINDRNLESQHINGDKDGQKDTGSKDIKPENKIGSMENLLKIIKVVSDTISQNTRRSFNGKMRYLHELKKSILDNIAERIDATWPDDDINVPHRRSRSAPMLPRGHHVQFPSSESALMTISFLTFAVFLIKLVLQIIQTYKNKSMMVAPVMVSAAGRTVLAHHGHH